MAERVAGNELTAEITKARADLAAHGLTSQQIANVLGVSRRALSGWAAGTIRPTVEHVAKLRALVAVASAIAERHPGHVRERILLPSATDEIWAAAARAAAAGLLTPIERRGTVRPEEEW